MPVYGYKCTSCGKEKDLLRKMEDRDAESPCPACGEPMRRTFDMPGLNFPGDDWTSKNLRVQRQMQKRREVLGDKQRAYAELNPKLIPNVNGEVVDSWSDAQKLAKEKGLAASTYDPMIQKAKE